MCAPRTTMTLEQLPDSMKTAAAANTGSKPASAGSIRMRDTGRSLKPHQSRGQSLEDRASRTEPRGQSLEDRASRTEPRGQSLEDRRSFVVWRGSTRGVIALRNARLSRGMLAGALADSAHDPSLVTACWGAA